MPKPYACLAGSVKRSARLPDEWRRLDPLPRPLILSLSKDAPALPSDPCPSAERAARHVERCAGDVDELHVGAAQFGSIGHDLSPCWWAAFDAVYLTGPRTALPGAAVPRGRWPRNRGLATVLLGRRGG